MAALLSQSPTSNSPLGFWATHLPAALATLACSVFLVGSVPCAYPLLHHQLSPGSSSTDTLWLVIPIPGPLALASSQCLI